MNEFSLNIELGNDMMSRPEHVAYALRGVSEAIERARQETFGKIRDDNGNVVGEWSFS